jgi:hypothetical protein
MLSPAAFVLPTRDSLSLGERIMAYLPRCADTDAEVRKVAIQVCVEVADPGSRTFLLAVKTLFHA